MKALLRSARVRTGLAILAFFLLLAFVGPLVLSAMGRTAENIDYTQLGRPPSGAHPLGTTENGQDVLNQLVFGARGSILTGLLVALFATVFATAMGLIGAYVGGWLDTILNGLTNIFLTVAGFPLLIVIASFLPNVGLLGVAFVIAIVSWPSGARTIRAQTLSLRNREFVIAMRMAGEFRSRLMFFEVLPHLVPVMSALFIGSFTAGILSQAGLSYLKLGGSTVNWGSMIADVQGSGAIPQGQWWWFVPPGLCIVLVGLAIVLINFGLDEIANPRLRGLTPKVLRRAIQTTKRTQGEGVRI